MIAGLLAFALAACASVPGGRSSVPPPDVNEIRANLMRDITVLASDEFGGRKPGTPGETLTTNYIIEQLRAAGLQSGTNNPGSEWRAAVPLISTKALEGEVAFTIGGRKVVLPPTEATALTATGSSLVEGAEVVFVGYDAQEVPADQVEGRVVIMLADDDLDLEGREALEDKAAAAVIVVAPYAGRVARVRSELQREKISLAGAQERVYGAVVSNEGMARVLGKKRWRTLRDSANLADFAPVALRATASIAARTDRREFTSYNVIGRIAGTKRDAGAVLLLAHWDHLGECAPDTADPICNGAVDNASGIAMILELARLLAASGPHDRDIYVLATSAEEQGLLGARAFVANPPMPLDTIVAAFNFDSVAIAPAGGKVGFVGEGKTPLDAIVKQVVSERERELGDEGYANTFLQRQDGWVLLEQGVPSVMITSAFASEIVLGPYLASHYHSPSDEADAVELGGAIEDLLLHAELVRRIADTSLYPSPISRSGG